MSLWVDSQFVTEADLNAEDPEVATGTDSAVDRAEHITLSGRNGLINVTMSECLADMDRASQGWGRARTGDRAADHFLILQDSLRSGERARERWIAEQVVVSSARPLDTPVLKKWVVGKTLTNLYRQAINKASDDRYMMKFELHKNRVRDYLWPEIMDTGVPIVNAPLYAPGAVNVHDSGTWSDANLSAVAGPGTLDKVSLYAVITWTKEGYDANDSTKNQGVHEGGPSAVARLDMTNGNVLQASIAGLNPPDGTRPNFGLGKPMVPISAANGWNLYVGQSVEDLRLQNPSGEFPLSQQTYVLPGNPVTDAPLLFHGQNPDAFIQVQHVRVRA